MQQVETWMSRICWNGLSLYHNQDIITAHCIDKSIFDWAVSIFRDNHVYIFPIQMTLLSPEKMLFKNKKINRIVHMLIEYIQSCKYQIYCLEMANSICQFFISFFFNKTTILNKIGFIYFQYITLKNIWISYIRWI